MSGVDRLILALANLLLWLRYAYHHADFSWRKRRLAQFAAPRQLCELVQWRKLVDHDPQFVTLTDKLGAKAWVAERAPDLPQPEVIWVGERAGNLPDALLAPGHVVKTNHASHQNIFPDRETLSRADIEQRLDAWLSRPYRVEQQWAYLGIRPRLFVERRVGDGRPMFDISFRVHGGVASAGHVATDYKTSAARDGYFLPDGRRIQLAADAGALPDDFVPPPSFHRARGFAEQLGGDADYFRVDFLCTEEEAYFGEITLYPASGMGSDDYPATLIYRSWLACIELSWFLATPQPFPLSLYQGAFRRWARLRNAELAREALSAP
ncbi:MAG: hypothetical protein IPK28_01300 [Devosia sp.]|nr:hypothetical protein [Devosia sp.]